MARRARTRDGSPHPHPIASRAQPSQRPDLLPSQALARGQELQEAIECRLAAERARAAAEEAMRTEMAWARSLDAMRLQDLAAIQQLEGKLAQWGVFHERHAPPPLERAEVL